MNRGMFEDLQSELHRIGDLLEKQIALLEMIIPVKATLEVTEMAPSMQRPANSGGKKLGRPKKEKT